MQFFGGAGHVLKIGKLQKILELKKFHSVTLFYKPKSMNIYQIIY